MADDQVQELEGGGDVQVDGRRCGQPWSCDAPRVRNSSLEKVL